jgi:hypothetical protein
MRIGYSIICDCATTYAPFIGSSGRIILQIEQWPAITHAYLRRNQETLAAYREGDTNEKEEDKDSGYHGGKGYIIF